MAVRAVPLCVGAKQTSVAAKRNRRAGQRRHVGAILKCQTCGRTFTTAKDEAFQDCARCCPICELRADLMIVDDNGSKAADSMDETSLHTAAVGQAGSRIDFGDGTPRLGDQDNDPPCMDRLEDQYGCTLPCFHVDRLRRLSDRSVCRSSTCSSRPTTKKCRSPGWRKEADDSATAARVAENDRAKRRSQREARWRPWSMSPQITLEADAEAALEDDGLNSGRSSVCSLGSPLAGEQDAGAKSPVDRFALHVRFRPQPEPLDSPDSPSSFRRQTSPSIFSASGFLRQSSQGSSNSQRRLSWASAASEHRASTESRKPEQPSTGSRSPPVARRNSTGSRNPQLEHQNSTGSRSSQLERRNSMGSRNPQVERRNSTGLRSSQLERRNSTGSRSSVLESRNSAAFPSPRVSACKRISSFMWRRIARRGSARGEEKEVIGLPQPPKKTGAMHDVIAAKVELGLSASDFCMLRQLFRRFDVDDSGELSVDDFKEVLTELRRGSPLPDDYKFNRQSGDPAMKMTFRDLLEWFASHGFSEDVVLSGLQQQVRSFARTAGIDADIVESAKECFDKHASAAAGSLSYEEFSEIVHRLMGVPDSMTLPASRAQHFWQEANSGSSATLDFEGFLGWWVTHYNASSHRSWAGLLEDFYSGMRLCATTPAVEVRRKELDSERARPQRREKGSAQDRDPSR